MQAAERRLHTVTLSVVQRVVVSRPVVCGIGSVGGGDGGAGAGDGCVGVGIGAGGVEDGAVRVGAGVLIRAVCAFILKNEPPARAISRN